MNEVRHQLFIVTVKKGKQLGEKVSNWGGGRPVEILQRVQIVQISETDCELAESTHRAERMTEKLSD